jgi:hypothetical protein
MVKADFRRHKLRQERQGLDSLRPAHASLAPPDLPRSLPVVPLSRGQRYYGEGPARLRRGPQDGLVRDWSKRRPEARLFRAPS